jgi:hypothetical protein
MPSSVANLPSRSAWDGPRSSAGGVGRLRGPRRLNRASRQPPRLARNSHAFRRRAGSDRSKLAPVVDGPHDPSSVSPEKADNALASNCGPAHVGCQSGAVTMHRWWARLTTLLTLSRRGTAGLNQACRWHSNRSTCLSRCMRLAPIQPERRTWTSRPGCGIWA